MEFANLPFARKMTPEESAEYWVNFANQRKPYFEALEQRAIEHLERELRQREQIREQLRVEYENALQREDAVRFTLDQTKAEPSGQPPPVIFQRAVDEKGLLCPPSQDGTFAVTASLRKFLDFVHAQGHIMTAAMVAKWLRQRDGKRPFSKRTIEDEITRTDFPR